MLWLVLGLLVQVSGLLASGIGLAEWGAFGHACFLMSLVMGVQGLSFVSLGGSFGAPHGHACLLSFVPCVFGLFTSTYWMSCIY